MSQAAAETLKVNRDLPAANGTSSIEVKRGSDLVRLGPVKLRTEGASEPTFKAPPIAGPVAEPANNPRDGPESLGARTPTPPPEPKRPGPEKPAPARKVAALKPPEGAE